jgi:SEC-C motif-containing protein
MSKKNLCPCGSKTTFDCCCGLYISGEKSPKTPEALMRSRYTAYTQANIPYIQQTMCGPASCGYDPIDAHRWAKQAQWLGLKVINSTLKNKKIGHVEFIARYRLNQQAYQIHERSEFHYINDRWYYVSGKMLNNS